MSGVLSLCCIPVGCAIEMQELQMLAGFVEGCAGLALQRRGGRKGTDIIGIARIPLSRIPIHDNEAIAAAAAALAEQKAVSCCPPLHNKTLTCL